MVSWAGFRSGASTSAQLTCMLDTEVARLRLLQKEVRRHQGLFQVALATDCLTRVSTWGETVRCVSMCLCEPGGAQLSFQCPEGRESQLGLV
jgi:hypothetical protein